MKNILLLALFTLTFCGPAFSETASVVEWKPVLESGNAKAPLAMMRMVPDGPDHPSTPAMRTIGIYVQGLDIPAEIVWGMRDPILALGLPAMKRFFPEAPVTETQGGHFLQEEVPVEIAASLLRVVDKVQTSKGGRP